MKIIKPLVELMTPIDTDGVMKRLELIGRVCYKSESRITDDSAANFIGGVIKRGHESIIEHVSLTFRIICDRGVSHEIVRHRLASYTQASTRYCNYASDKFGGELTFIKPYFWNRDEVLYTVWYEMMSAIESTYLRMVRQGAKPERARSILPNSLATELIMTANLREWRHFLKLRTAKDAHPQMREVALMIQNILADKLPVIFGGNENVA